MFLANLIDILSHAVYLLLHVAGAGSFPRALSAAAERKALDEMAKGDKGARQRLIEHNLRLVAHIVKKYYGGSEQEDLISIGTIGLIKAVDTFDPDKGIRLSSYASRCIENEILMSFRWGRKTARDVSINEPIDSDRDGSALTLMDTMAAEDTVVDDLDLRMKSEQLYGYLPALEPRERNVIVMRYGLGGRKALPQREVAAKLGISRSYVSRIEKRALEKLRARFEEG